MFIRVFPSLSAYPSGSFLNWTDIDCQFDSQD